jgi:predicted translin family RNA/ssDNA-binding protein
MPDSETAKQIENISDITKEQMDEWMNGVFEEFDWTTRNKQKVSDALEEIQEKLRPYEDQYLELVNNHQKDSSEALEIKEKITVLRNKLKEVYQIYKKDK